jgi:low temperature requirement protein LtrA
VIDQHAEAERAVTPLELFFDLVFVFGFTQVTTLLTDDPTWRGLGHALLVLCALWWTWAAYAWLTNLVDPEVGPSAAAVLVAVGAMFVAGLAVPHAFGSHAVLFGAAFLIVRVMHLALLALAARRDTALLRAVALVTPSTLAGSVLILVAGFVHGAARPVLWALAIALGLFGPVLSGLVGWTVRPAHFVERHGLIVIIAIGESFIAIGLGAAHTHLGAGVVVAALLGLVVATSFWLAYFDFFAIRARGLLAARTGDEQAALARDTFTYLHLPMIVGIILFAFALKTTLAHVHDELDVVPAVALCEGSALYLLAYVGLRFRVSRTIGGGRFVAAIASALLLPAALEVPAVAAVALVAAVWVGLHAYEFIWWRDERAQARAERLAMPTA